MFYCVDGMSSSTICCKFKCYWATILQVSPQKSHLSVLPDLCEPSFNKVQCLICEGIRSLHLFFSQDILIAEALQFKITRRRVSLLYVFFLIYVN